MNHNPQQTKTTLTEESTASVSSSLTRRLFLKSLLLGLPAMGAVLLTDKPEVAEASHESFWELDGNNLHGPEFVGSLNNQPLTLKTNNQTRMTITSGGNVGIGTPNPLFQLHVLSTGPIGVFGQGRVIGTFGESQILGVLGRGVTGVKGEGRMFGVSGEVGVVPTFRRGTILLGASVLGVVNSIEDLSRFSFGIWGIHRLATGLAGRFDGNVSISGTLFESSSVSKIDHPLDPENKFLSHASVQSPDMMNIYNGTVTLDANGTAVVELPSYFEAFNRDFTYQLTCIGGSAPVYIADEIHNNRFNIAGGIPGMKVSWQVTGVRQDPYAEAHRIRAEEDKPDRERGSYLAPEEYGQPETKRTDYEQIQQAISRAVSTTPDSVPMP